MPSPRSAPNGVEVEHSEPFRGRIHFGMVAGSSRTAWRYSGIGLTFMWPDVHARAVASAANSLSFDGGVDPALTAQMKEWADDLGVGGVALDIAGPAPRHAGFGTGTQARLCALRALATVHGHPLDPERTAQLANRGGASGIGSVHRGVDEFIVDLGRVTAGDGDLLPSAAASGDIGRPCLRLPAPRADLVLIRPREGGPMSGPREVEAISRIGRRLSERDVDEACRVLLSLVLPAIVRREPDEIASALRKFQELPWKRAVRSELPPAWTEFDATIRERLGQPYLLSSWGPGGVLIVRRGEGEAVAAEVSALLSDLGSGCTIGWGPPD